MVAGPDLACHEFAKPCSGRQIGSNLNTQFKADFLKSCHLFVHATHISGVPTLLGKIRRLRAVVDKKDEANVDFVLKELERYLKHI